MKLILDLDTGIDDALAIVYALGSPEAELIGITGTYGNVPVELGVRNALAVLELLGHPEVPVFLGCNHPLARENFSVGRASARMHGANGLGGVALPEPARAPETMHAVDFILDASRTYGSELVIVPTGAMTTMACAFKRDPDLAARVGRVVFMGGALTVRGNVTPVAEANIFQDPEAADKVFLAGAPTTMVGLDVTLQTLLTEADVARWRKTGAAGETFADILAFYLDAYAQTAPYLGGCGLHDPLAVAVALDPTLVRMLPVPLRAELEGKLRARTIGDLARRREGIREVNVAIEVDVDRFKQEFMARTLTVFAAAERKER